MSQQLLMQPKTRYNLFLILALTTGFDIVLLAYRAWYLNPGFHGINSIEDLHCRAHCNFIFLIWNLFLAWIPYWVAMSLNWVGKRTSSSIIVGLILIIWLLFFPNAPYIITDFLHLKHRPPVPLWYDLSLLFAFAWTGLILGFLSLMEVQQFLQKRYSNHLAWTVTVLSLLLCGFGIFIGRFQRWNSWDVITNPIGLVQDLFGIISNPFAHGGTLGLAVVLSSMLILGYMTLIILIRGNKIT